VRHRCLSEKPSREMLLTAKYTKSKQVVVENLPTFNSRLHLLSTSIIMKAVKTALVGTKVSCL